MSLFGRAWGHNISGRVRIDDREADLSSVTAAIDAGLAYVTEDRKQFGLILADDVRKNITLASLDRVASRWVIDDIRELKAASDYRARMRIRCSDVYQEAGQLSGGNQQKVVLSKWLMTDPKVLILDEPTRGIDVGAKYEIYCIINELAAAGKGVVVISSEMPELLGICDRICVMNDGAFVGEFAAADATQEKIMRAIMRNKVMRTARARTTCRREPCGHDRQDRFASARAPACRVHQEQFAHLWHAAVAVCDHAVLPGHDRRHAAAAAQPDQSRAAEQLHRHHGARHAAGDRDRTYRPLGRLGRRLRRRGRRGADGPLSGRLSPGVHRMPAGGRGDRGGARLLGRLFRDPFLHRYAGRHAGLQGPCARAAAGPVRRAVSGNLPEIVVRLHPGTASRRRNAAPHLAVDRHRAGLRARLCQRAGAARANIRTGSRSSLTRSSSRRAPCCPARCSISPT